MRMENVFKDYAAFYDVLYQDKDYYSESLFVSEIIRKFNNDANSNIEILDLACGTGRHARELKKMGYLVNGSDISEEMIYVARQECEREKIDIRFYNESFQSSNNIKNKYDVILSMFASIDYLTTYNDLSIALTNIHSLLKDDGIFIFDFWNGNAVVDYYSPLKIKRMKKNDIDIIRISETAIDKISQIASVKFNFIMLKNSMIITEFDELHLVRYFFLQEMVDILAANGFKTCFRCPFLKNDEEITPLEWNITCVAKKEIHESNIGVYSCRGGV